VQPGWMGLQEMTRRSSLVFLMVSRLSAASRSVMLTFCGCSILVDIRLEGRLSLVAKSMAKMPAVTSAAV